MKWLQGIIVLLGVIGASAGDLAFSDPAHTPPPPAGSVGFASRALDLDALPGFQKPPPGYGIVPFYWWLGDPLTKERLAWQLEQMEGMGVSGYQINYAHSDRGGRSYGLSFPSEPAIFSKDWWDLTGWFMGAAKKQGAGISLSDYTLGFGQGYMVDALLRDHPEVMGQELRMDKDGKVAPETVPWSLNPMHPMAGRWYAERFFGQFEDKFPGEGGKGLNFFFSDELGFGVKGHLWSTNFAAEFQKRKGYDITPELAALFKDTGPRTHKIRLDYRDVLAALSEECFFKPVFDWHQQRGMIMGCDHGGRGRNVGEFGDYFRTQRWNQGPGADQPGLGKDLIKAKVAASIAHLYQRPRVWLEGFYGSGWGTTSEGLVDATFANYAMGFNLLGLHGMYYATHGGWWEWAPPDNTFRMPYWKHLRTFMDCQQRLAYLLSQGDHRCDVAILYPVAPVEADFGGKEAVAVAFQTAQQIYAKGIDFDFMDFESLARATIAEKELQVSGERYRVLILPGMRAIRHETLKQAVAFKRAGGVVLAVGALPEVSDRIGRDDPEVAAMVKELFPGGASADVVAAIPFRDYIGPGYILHRRIGPRDVYAVYNAPQGTTVTFRATGQVELWDPWSGTARPLAVTAQSGETTTLKLPLTEKEMQILVFSPGTARMAVQSQISDLKSQMSMDGSWSFELAPTLDNRFGDFHWPPTAAKIGAEARRLKYADETTANPGWQDPTFDDAAWSTVTCGFGPRFWKLGPLPDTAEADAVLAAIDHVDPGQPVRIGGMDYRWQPYEFSWRFGIEGDCAHQGYHGLKEQVADEFIGLGAIKHGHPSCRREVEKGGSRYYLWTSVGASKSGSFPVSRGGLQPAKVWLNGAPLAASAPVASLKAGGNPLLLRYDAIGRGYFVVGSGEATVAAAPTGPVFSAAAQWIWWPNDTGAAANRYFRRVVSVPAPPASARIRITCDNGYTLFVNGREIGRGNAWAKVQEYEVASVFRMGENVVAVDARNEGQDAGLIAEVVLRDAAGRETRVGTDPVWRCVREATKGWLESGFDAAAWQRASVVSPFAGSLWAKHQQGPPRLDGGSVTVSAQPVVWVWNTNLAMRWHGDAKVLPFDTRPATAQPAGWYRFVAPPGLRGLTLPTRGRVRAWADGKEIEARSGDGVVRVSLAEPARVPVVVALRVEQERGEYGGAAFREFIRLDCSEGELALGNWAKAGVLETYSGAAWYRKAVTLSKEQALQRVTLDLGTVVASAEVRVNGQPAGIKVSPPWTLDITEHVKPGENRIEVLVCSTLANHYVTIPTHYRGDTKAGLLGPVRLEFSAP